MEDAVEQFKGWYFAQPIFTRSFLTACTIQTLLLSFGMVSPFTLIYSFRQTFFQLQLWRPFTALVFMGKFDFGFIFNVYFAYLAINKVETQVFSRERYADFLWLTIMLFGGCVALGSLFNMVVFTEPFLMSLVYIWCKRMPH
jgi:di/tricarboxylate transporter